MLDKFGLVETNASAVRVGDLFGRLSVIAVGQAAGTYRYYAVCQCSCGSKPKKIRQDGLKSGVVESCGCLQKERTTKHGMTESIHYDRWKNMIDRCVNEKCSAYENYGGRGIKVCDRWLSLPNFIEDMSEGYFEGAEIDREDNDGNYEPGNVRWATRSENNDNRRSGRKLTFNGKTQSQRAWAKELGLKDQLIDDRISNLGWSVERALTEKVMTSKERTAKALAARYEGYTANGRPPPKTSRKLLRVQHNGREMTLAELSGECGISAKDLRRRIAELGWPVDRAIIK